jgi:hypothetical protein
MLNPEYLNKFQIELDFNSKRIKNKMSKPYKVRKTEADKYFSRAIRTIGVLRHNQKAVEKFCLYTYRNGLLACKCFTCHRVLPYRSGLDFLGAECGHYICRKSILTRYDYYNCHVQGKYCNNHKKGEQTIHGKNIDHLYKNINGMLPTNYLELRRNMSSGAKIGKERLLEIEEIAKLVVKSASKILDYKFFKE